MLAIHLPTGVCSGHPGVHPRQEQILHHCSLLNSHFSKLLELLQALYRATKQPACAPAAGESPWLSERHEKPQSLRQAQAACLPCQPQCCPDLPPPHPTILQKAPWQGSVLPLHLAAATAITQEQQGFLSPCSQGFRFH